MKYIARGESQVVNITQGQAELAPDSHQELYTFIQTKVAMFYCILHLRMC